MKTGLNKLLDWFCNFLSLIVILLTIAGMAWILVAPTMKLLDVTSMPWFSLTHLSVIGFLITDMATIAIIFIIATFVSEMRTATKINQD